MSIQIPIKPLIPQNQRSGLDVSQHVQSIKSNLRTGSAIDTAQAFLEVQGAIQFLEQQLRASQNNVLPQIFITGPNGQVIGWIGTNGGYQGAWFKTLYVGGTDPSKAPLVADASGNLSITNALITLTGTGGTIVLDPAGGGTPTITVASLTNAPGQVLIQPGSIAIQQNDFTGNSVVLNHNGIGVSDGAGGSTGISPSHIDISSVDGYINIDALSGGNPGIVIASATNTPGQVSASAGSIVVQRNDFTGSYVTIGTTAISVDDRAGNVSHVRPSKVDTPLVDSNNYSVSGTPGIDNTSTFGTSVSVSTASFIKTVTGVGITFTSGPAVTSVTLNTATRVWSKGILTS